VRPELPAPDPVRRSGHGTSACRRARFGTNVTGRCVDRGQPPRRPV